MAREIKFRAFDKDSSTMLYPEDYSHDDLYLDCPSGEPFLMASKDNYDDYSCGIEIRNAVIMQYTGVKDKNGKEIYESDIVSCKLLCPESNNCWITQWPILVEWSEYGYEPFIEYGAPDYSFSIEVIGNIYENPELLEVEND